MTHRLFAYSFAALVFSIGILTPIVDVQAKEASVSISDIKTVVAPPTCKVYSTKKWITAGKSTKIAWESKGADYLANFMSDTAQRPTKGSERVAIASVGKHEFPLTFVGPGGKTTCTAKVFVHPKKKAKGT
ncbi:MAG: hypothetical protein QG636_247 [Patescibacteria group bacterium]|jgi:hypothetical protein|nr:hypothetical protein [Patescibacteria group bacterium]